MTIYLVIEDYGYDGQSVAGAFSTTELAQQYIDCANKSYAELYIEDYNLDEALGEVPTQRRPQV
jgi:hypothetical protein